MSNTQTKNNHFVPQFYLKKFLNSSNTLCMLDKKYGKKYERNIQDLKRIASKKNLYSISKKISNNDITCYKIIFKLDDHYITNEVINYLVAFLNDDFGSIVNLHTSSSAKIEPQHLEEIKKEIQKKIKNVGIAKRQEHLFCMYENDFQPIYDDILTQESILQIAKSNKTQMDHTIFPSIYITKKILGSIANEMQKQFHQYDEMPEPVNFLDDFSPNKYFDFLHYIINQHLRTPKIIDSKDFENDPKIQALLKKYNVCRTNIMFLFIHHHSLTMLDDLTRNKFKPILIKNATKVGFITSDNPCINIHTTTYNALGSENLEIYFPLSPNISILLTNKNCYENIDEIIATKNDILQYNKKIYEEADRYIYSTNNLKDLQLFYH